MNLTIDGAVAGTGVDAAVPAHYGDPFGEQRRLVEEAAFVDRSHRGILRVTGGDRLSWLHSLTTQHLSALPAGHAAEALILSAHGHVEHHLLLADDGTATYLDVEPDTAATLLDYLVSMRFMLDVEPTDVSDDFALFTVAGAAAADRLAAALAAPPTRPWELTTLAGSGWIRAVPASSNAAADDAPIARFDVLVPRTDLPTHLERLQHAGITPAGHQAFEALRVAARIPRVGAETDHRTLPHELGWIGTAVHLNKGCYRGQETVAKVHHRGQPPRQLRLLHLDGSADVLPSPGTPIVVDEKTVGFVGTALHHYELGPIALGLVRRQVPETAQLSIAGMNATIDADLPE